MLSGEFGIVAARLVDGASLAVSLAKLEAFARIRIYCPSNSAFRRESDCFCMSARNAWKRGS